MPKTIIQEIPPSEIKSLVRHTIVSGKSGSGKSNACEWILTNYFEIGKTKSIDVYDDGRHENMLYGLEENDNVMLKKTYELTGKYSKSYPNQIIVIGGKGIEYRRKLPSNLTLMSFDYEDLNIDDLFYLLGRSEKLEGFLASVSNIYGDNINMKQLYDLLTKGKIDGIKPNKKPYIPDAIRGMVIRNIRRWLNSGMFSETLPKINFKTIMSDLSCITSFSTFLLDEEESKRTAYGLILKKIYEIKKKREVKNRINVYIREMSEFFEPNWDLSKKYILKILRQGRDIGVDLLTDMQRVFDIPSKYRRQFGLIIQLRTDFEDSEKLLSFQSGIPIRYLRKSSTWGAGEGILLTGATWEYPIIFPPCHHCHKKEYYDVLKMLGDKFGWVTYSTKQIEAMLNFDLQDKEFEEENLDENYNQRYDEF